MDPEAGTDKGTPEAPPLGHVAEWQSWAIDHLDGRLNTAQAAAVESHLVDCPACRAELQRQKGVRRLLHDLEQVAPPAYLEAAVLDALAPLPATRQQPVRGGGRNALQRTLDGIVRRPWIPAAVAAVVVLVALAGSADFFPLGMGGGDSATTPAAAPEQTAQGAADTGAAPADTSAPGTTAAAGAASPSTEVAVATGETVGMGTGTSVSALALDSTTTLAPSVGSGESSPGSSTTVPDSDTARSSAPASQTVWVTFASGTPGVDPASSAAVVESVTGLAPLPPSQSLGGPTYAALISPSDLDLVLGLLRDAGLTVQVSGQPSPQSDRETVDGIAESRAASYPVLSGTPAGDVSTPSGGTDANAAASGGYVLMVLAPGA